ncbi:glycosyltransferase [Halobellus sp. Atlit-31R]|nr:glycosyltransferase [Halobellus sp. Atlit-31R]
MAPSRPPADAATAGRATAGTDDDARRGAARPHDCEGRAVPADGEYRLRDGVRLVDDVLVSKRPLTATRLNDAAVGVVDGLVRAGGFRPPEALASGTGPTATATETLCEHLRQRGFLEWRPARDPEHTPPVSVVVTVRDDREHLRACLDALADLEYPAYEVVVVDDGSSDGTREVARSHALAGARRLRVVSVGTVDAPLGIGASRNRGVAAAAYDVVAFTDADCRPRAGWLADLVPHLAAHDLVGGRIRPAGDATASVYEAHNSSLDMGPRAARVDPGGATPYLATANLVGRRAVFESVPFPERDVAEDVAVCWGALDAGFDVVYTPTGVVEHAYRTELRSFVRRRAAYGASEALLARERGREEMDRVNVSATVLAVVALVGGGLAASGGGGSAFPASSGAGGGPASLAAIASGAGGGPASLSTLAFGVAAVVFAVGALAGGTARWRQHRRLAPAVTAGDVLRSRARERLSGAYAVARELTRYYAGPLAGLGVVSGAVGVAGGLDAAALLGAGLLALVGLALALPPAVEYWVSTPETSVYGYAGYYLADHLAYQYGVYRGAIEHRTLSHLRPSARFRLSGASAALLERLRGVRSP